jgi:hypothetical protein
MHSAQNQPIPTAIKLRLHIDGGASRSLTNDASTLLGYRNIKSHYMSSAGGESDIKGIRIGYLPWWAPNGEIILIKCYHSPQAVDTIISPSDIVSNHITKHKSWTHHADFKTNDGYIAFTNKKTGKMTKYPLRQNNGLWYFFQVDAQDYQTSTTPIIRQLTSAGKYHLYPHV